MNTHLSDDYFLWINNPGVRGYATDITMTESNTYYTVTSTQRVIPCFDSLHAYIS